MMINKKAFTMSEVLITLGIVGVVSAVTMPILVKNYQKNVTANKLKQTYSILAQALEKAKVDYGDMNTWDFYNGTYTSQELSGEAARNSKNFFDKYLVPYLKHSEDIKVASLNQMGYKNGIFYSNNERFVNKYYEYAFFKLQNGTLLLMGSNFNGTTRILGDPFIMVDINGNQPPNKMGKDIFLFSVIKKGLVCQRYYPITNCNTSCACFIMDKGWKIPNNYPW